MDQSDAELPVPEARPPIPRGQFWASIILSILVPPGLTCLLLKSRHLEDWPVIMFAVILFSVPYIDALKMRYRGRSLVLLAAAYTVGEIVVCYALAVLPFMIRSFV